MTQFLLDSDILIDFFNKQPSIVQFIENLSPSSSIFVSTISLTEVISGWTPLQQRKYYPVLFDTYEILNADTSIAIYAGELRSQYFRKGIPLSVPDTIIAATAIKTGAYFITRNKKDFPMPELKIYEELTF